MLQQRTSGILMPVSSLPSPYGIGTLGKESYRFIDFLHRSNMKIWQMLPLLPTGYGDSPYQSVSANALNYYFIDFDILQEQGLLEKEDYASIEWCYDPQRIDYGALFQNKTRVLKKAFSRFDRTNERFVEFLKQGELEDFAIFMTLKTLNGYKTWKEWGEYSVYDEEKIERLKIDHADDIAFWQFTQFIFVEQWKQLKAYAMKRGIRIMGDMPLYLAYDSVEAWKYGKDLFLLDEDLNPVVVAGVPPDAFSAEGQLWGNPIYDWKKMEQNDYTWWRGRLEYAFRFFDIIRIDHFRAFDRYCAIPFGDKNALNGKWVDGPKNKLFAYFKDRNIVAEDLGIIDEGVVQLLSDVGYPGMKVWSLVWMEIPIIAISLPPMQVRIASSIRVRMTICLSVSTFVIFLSRNMLPL